MNNPIGVLREEKRISRLAAAVELVRTTGTTVSMTPKRERHAKKRRQFAAKAAAGRAL